MTMEQEYQIADRVWFELPWEPALRGVPRTRCAGWGNISKIFLRMAEINYVVRLDEPVLGSSEWTLCGDQVRTHLHRRRPHGRVNQPGGEVEV